MILYTLVINYTDKNHIQMLVLGIDMRKLKNQTLDHYNY